jgi:ribonuclease BN (tRNA processing enzyme)
MPDVDRGPAGFLVQVGGRSWLVDGGTGTLQRCRRAGVDPLLLDGGFYSHHHVDHCADLVPLLFGMKVAAYMPDDVPQRARPYPIVAGQGFRAYFDKLKVVHGSWMEPPSGVEVHELPLDGEGVWTDGELTLRTRPANHEAAALHLRFDARGRSVVFSGDTGPSDALVELARGVDLLVCECASSDDAPVGRHLGPSQVREIVAAARPREVWLTHLYPGVDPELALATVEKAGVPVRRARDLDVFG